MIPTQTKQAIYIDSLDGDELAKQLFGFSDVKAKATPLYFLDDNGVLRFRFHKYQKRAMGTRRRFVLLLGGTQSGKTSFGPIWLHREIKLRGAGDYLAVAPTYPLMNKKMLPEFLAYFQTLHNLGTYNKTDKIFTFSEAGQISMFGEAQGVATTVHFGHAQDPDSLESATAKAAWLDECGQKKFKLASFEAIMRRLGYFMGRVLMTTTPYYLGWLKTMFADMVQNGLDVLNSISVISFPSIANPSFPRDEYERAKRDLPKWKFDMFYNAKFTRPAGLIYDCFDTKTHTMPKIDVSPAWYRFIGVDFGGVNTAGVFIAKPSGQDRYYIYKEYHAQKTMTAREHVSQMLSGERGVPLAYGGSWGEGNWRAEFGAVGLPVNKPQIKDVEVGINRVYSMIQSGKIVIFDDCVELLDELASYSRQLDDEGKPTAAIDNKSDYHLLDALRYICTHLYNDGSSNWQGELENAIKERR